MNFHHLKNVLLLSKTLHFTKTANQINVVQPALSKQVQQLEKELAVNLFKRTKRNVTLTPSGVFFFQEVEKLLFQMDRIKEKTKTIHAGGATEIRIGFTHSVLQTILPEVLQKITAQFPGAQTILKELNNKDQYKALKNRDLDLSFATNPIIPEGLKGRKLDSHNFAVVLPRDHKISQGNFKDFSVFANEEFIFPPLGNGTNYPRILESICRDAGFNPKVTHVTGSASTSFKLIERGMGISIEPMTSLYKQDLAVKYIELTDIPQKAELTMIWNQDFESEYPNLLKVIGQSEDYKSLSF